MVRLNMVHGLGPTLQIVEGCTVNLPDPVADGVTNRTDPTWPQVFSCRAAPTGPPVEVSTA